MISVLLCIISIFLFIVPASADTINLYGSLDDSNQYCNMLIDVMQNDINYDVLDEYVCLRTGQYEYKICFGKSLDQEYSVYTYVPSISGSPAHITYNTSNDLFIRDNGYYYVGNVPGSLSSLQYSQYKQGIIIVGVIVLIALLIGFYIFRHTTKRNITYYKMR